MSARFARITLARGKRDPEAAQLERCVPAAHRQGTARVNAQAMLWTLLIKDLRRARHNPWPYLINLALPLCITALVGLVFGPSSKGGGLGQIKLAVVDEDDSVLSSLLRGAMNQGDFKKHLEARFLERKEAFKQ